MAEKLDPCIKGLTPECFAANPTWAKMAFAYRLFCALAPPHISRRLQKYLIDAIFGPGVDFPTWYIPPPGMTFPPGFVFPPGWQPGDPWPPDYPLPPIVPPPPGNTGPNPPGYISPWEPGPSIVPGRSPAPGELITIRLFCSLSNGYVVSRADSWLNARNGNDYLNAVSDEFSDGSAMSAFFEASKYYVKRAFLYFDLSGIPAGSSIKSAILGVVGRDNAESTVRVYEGTQEDPLVSTDFDAYTGYPFASQIWEKYSAPDLNTNEMTLSSGARTYIQSVIGSTAKFCLREDTKDRANVAPVDVHPLNGITWAKWPDTDLDPYLELIYR